MVAEKRSRTSSTASIAGRQCNAQQVFQGPHQRRSWSWVSSAVWTMLTGLPLAMRQKNTA